MGVVVAVAVALLLVGALVEHAHGWFGEDDLRFFSSVAGLVRGSLFLSWTRWRGFLSVADLRFLVPEQSAGAWPNVENVAVALNVGVRAVGERVVLLAILRWRHARVGHGV